MRDRVEIEARAMTATFSRFDRLHRLVGSQTVPTPAPAVKPGDVLVGMGKVKAVRVVEVRP